MCYVRLPPEQMAPIGQERSADEWIAMAQQARDAGMVFLLLTGGEPMLRPDFCQIFQAVAGMGLSITVNTNGTLLTEPVRRLWHQSPPAQVNITLYGTCRADYAALCGNPDAFDAVVDALDWLAQEGILVHLNTTMVPTNLHKWQEIEEFAKARGLELRMTTYCYPPTRRCGNDFERLDPEVAGDLMVKDIYYREGAEAILIKAADLDVPTPHSCELDNGEPMQCTAAKSQFWMTWYGGMTPCGMLPQPEAFPLKEGFPAAWESLRGQTAEIRLCPDCVHCPQRHTCLNCAAVMYTETGRFDGKPEYMCRMNQAYRVALKQYSQTDELP
jgi:MoaA/NifB/PqqE/SkfB family radical SAM enzyme